MTSCDAVRHLLSAYLDGELVGEDRAAFETHLAQCDACRRALAGEEDGERSIREALPRAQAPEALRRRVEALVHAEVPRERRWLAPGVAAAAVLAAALAGLWATARGPEAPRPSEFAGLAADTHLRHTRGQLPLEVRSEKADEVSRWFSGRVPFNVTLPDYPVGPGEQKFYRLMGGRLVSFQADYAAYVAYRMDERPISLLVTSADRVQPAGGDTVRFAALTFHQESVAGLKVITWSDNGLTYALVSDLAVSGSQSCMVCHGSPQERQKIEGFSVRPGI